MFADFDEMVLAPPLIDGEVARQATRRHDTRLCIHAFPVSLFRPSLMAGEQISTGSERSQVTLCLGGLALYHDKIYVGKVL